MKHILMAFILAFSIAPALAKQSSASKSKFPEGERLRNAFIVATNDYIASLQKLRIIYERNIVRAEERLAQSRDLYERKMISMNQLEVEQRALDEARGKVAEMDERVAHANKQLADLPSDAELEREHRKAKRSARKNTACSNWTLTASRRETKRGVTLSWKLVCSR